MQHKLKAEIQKRINEKAIDIAKLEKLAGLKKDSIRNITNGRTIMPNIGLVMAISKVFNCSVEELMGIDPPPTSNPSFTTNASQAKTSHQWSHEIFTEILDTLHEQFLANDICPTAEQVFQVAEEIYYYTIESDSKVIDKTFVRWSIKKLQIIK